MTLVRKDNFKFIHARGHVPAMIAFFVHFFSSISYIFDFRGLWADERIDKGSWDTSKYSHNIQYRAMKFLERKLLEKAEHVVVLSEIVTSEIISISNKSHKNITVIPCCADYKHFNLNELTNTNEIKNNLGISLDSIVIGYIGSVGKMYRVDKLFEFFEICNLEHQNVEFLFITNDLKELSLLKDKYLGEFSMPKFKSVSSHRKDVPKYLSIVDIGLSFIEPSYARQAASPTKLAEYFAMGIPVISSSGVGDTEKIIKLINGGDIINHDNKDELLEAAKNIDKYKQIDSLSIRNESKKFFDLNQGGGEVSHDLQKNVFKIFMINVVILNGGRGAGTIIPKLLEHKYCNVISVVNAYDDGKSTGEIRKFFGMLGPSDIRKVQELMLPRENKDYDEHISLFQYRYPEKH